MEAYLCRQIHDLLLNARKPLFISDERIDGDSLGASLAMVDYLQRLGKTVPVYVKYPVPEKYRRLPHIESCTHDPSVFNDPEVDLVVSFDCSDGRYIGELVSRLPGRPAVVNIDHHATNPRYGQVNLVITGSPATAEVVHRFFAHNSIVPSKDAATCLLTGICFDTTVLSNSGSNERAFRAASDLILCGARIQDVIRAMFQNRSVPVLRLWGTALERLYKDPEHGFLSTFLTRSDLDGNGVTDEEADGLSDFLNLVTDADTLFVLRETAEGGIKVSMRSHRYDVARIARLLGGGGHVKAAGFTVANAKFACGADGRWKVEERDNK